MTRSGSLAAINEMAHRVTVGLADRLVYGKIWDPSARAGPDDWCFISYPDKIEIASEVHADRRDSRTAIALYVNQGRHSDSFFHQSRLDEFALRMLKTSIEHLLPGIMGNAVAEALTHQRFLDDPENQPLSILSEIGELNQRRRAAFSERCLLTPSHASIRLLSDKLEYSQLAFSENAYNKLRDFATRRAAANLSNNRNNTLMRLADYARQGEAPYLTTRARHFLNAFLEDGIRNRPEIEKTAKNLLIEHLSERQKQQYSQHGYFEVVGNKTKHTYRIHEGTQQNILDLDSKDMLNGICFLPGGGLPVGDVMLAQKLALEQDEAEALRIANKFRFHKAYGGAHPYSGYLGTWQGMIFYD